ncbi:MAG: ATP synthase F0 subunit C [Pyrinomonadaceae bacterium]|jgi:F-type H+-transporting ATPase subunit c|nr:ATP synthase F0 subunit C [Pyrinomonadaceae bacterium]
MNKLKHIFFSFAALALLSVSAFAQAGAADNQSTVDAYTAIGTGLGVLGFGLAAGLAGIGQGLVGSKGAEGAARNPGAAGTIQTLMIIALALIESLVLFALLIVFLKIK